MNLFVSKVLRSSLHTHKNEKEWYFGCDKKISYLTSTLSLSYVCNCNGQFRVQKGGQENDLYTYRLEQ